MNEKLLHSRRDAAEMLGVSIRKVDSLLAEGKVQGVKIGKRILISTGALKKFVHNLGKSNALGGGKPE